MLQHSLRYKENMLQLFWKCVSMIRNYFSALFNKFMPLYSICVCTLDAKFAFWVVHLFIWSCQSSSRRTRCLYLMAVFESVGFVTLQLPNLDLPSNFGRLQSNWIKLYSHRIASPPGLVFSSADWRIHSPSHSTFGGGLPLC